MKILKSIGYRTVSLLLVLCMIASISVSAVAESESADQSAKRGDTIDVVMLTKNVSSGRKIKKTDVEIKTFKNVNIPENVISDVKMVIGKYAKTGLYAGEYVYAEQLSAKSVASSNSHLLNQAVTRSEEKYLDITDYVNANTGADLTTIIQNVIDKNPKRTIYFPDGEYIISRPLTTRGAANSAVSLWLADGAIIKADPLNWRSEGSLHALICLGSKDFGEMGANDVITVGSYYSLQGGTLDCSGVAEGVSIDGGRETLVKNILIKDAHGRGVHIKKGANNQGPQVATGSSDADLHNITIVCDGKAGSVGLHIDKGLDNHFSSFRIYDAQVGIKIETAGNSLKNMRVYYTHDERLSQVNAIYDQTIGIQDTSGDNFYTQCYVENYATAYSLRANADTLDTCTARWTSDTGGVQTAFSSNSLRSCASEFRACFSGTAPRTAFFKGSGSGAFESPIFKTSLSDDKTYESYVRYGIVPMA